MKLLLLLFILRAATAEEVAEANVTCGIGNHTIRINKTYAFSLLEDGIFDGIAIVNTSNPNLTPICNFTEEGDEFVFRPDGDTLMDCPVEIMTTAMNLVEIFNVQLFRSPPAGAIIDRGRCYRWRFQCETDRELSVSNMINTYARSFVFNASIVGSVNYTSTITFYNDSGFTQVLNADQIGYINGSYAFMSVVVDAPSNIALLLTSCRAINTDSGGVTNIIIDARCGAPMVDIDYASPPNQRVNVTFPVVFDTPADSNFSNEFFDVECVTEVCDRNADACDTTCDVRRRKRSASARKVVVVSGSFRVRDSCSTQSCSHGCRHDHQGQAECYCREGFVLKTDGKSCEEIVDQLVVISSEVPPAPAAAAEVVPHPQLPPSPIPSVLSSPPTTTTTQTSTTTTSTTTQEPKPQNPQLDDEEPPISFKSQEDIFETFEENEAEVEESPSGFPQVTMLSVIIGLAVLLCILMMALLHQHCRPKRKSLSVADTLARSSGEIIP